MNAAALKKLLDQKVDFYNQPSFIKDDPVCVPHRFTQLQDIEIAGFFAAIFAWGNRTTIINKATELLQRMDNAPHAFCTQHSASDLKRLIGFKHRTFTDTDLLYFVEFFKQHYQQYQSLETAFTLHGSKMEEMLNGFHHYFFSLEHIPARTRKHIASPERGSACKRINMFLRWMVRSDNRGVDFGLWKNIQPAQLICPIDLHVARVAKRLGILQQPKSDWSSAVSLTSFLQTLDPADPVKYDFALFALGVHEKF